MDSVSCYVIMSYRIYSTYRPMQTSTMFQCFTSRMLPTLLTNSTYNVHQECVCAPLWCQFELSLSPEQRTLDVCAMNHPTAALSCSMLINYRTGNCPQSLYRLSFRSRWLYWFHTPTITRMNLQLFRPHTWTNFNTSLFYFWDMHPVAFVIKTLLWWPSIATKFFIYFLYFTHVTTCCCPCGPSSGECYRFLEASYCL
jgi:hypothetical protein